MTMNRTTLAETVAELIGGNRANARLTVDATFDAMLEALVRGEDVKISGYGTFAPRTLLAREGRNPRTGEKIEIAASVGVSFKLHKPLKDALNAPRRKVGGERVDPATLYNRSA